MEFVCRVGTPDGRVVEQVLEAPHEGAARGDLEGRGLHVFEVRQRGWSLASLLERDGRRRPIKDVDFMLFNQELASLLKAGLPLLQALDMMLERQRDPSFRKVLEEIRDRVRSGEELSTAFRAFPDVFPPLYAPTLMAGERSGDLEQVIRRFVRYLQLVIDTRKKVVSALTYPVFLILLALVMLVVMAVVVIPKFEVFYEAMDVELPTPTAILLSTSIFLQNNFWLLAVGLVIGYLAARRWLRTEVGRRLYDRWRLRIPVAGAILHRFSVSEFCRSLGTLLAGGMPLVPSLEVAVDAISNAHLRERMAPVVPAVREGAPFHHSLDQTGVFDDLAIDLVKVGEATGALDEMLVNVSDFFDEEVETRTQRMLSLLEPIMLVIMGVTVCLLLMAMYLPLFSVLGRLE
ncbi:MAG: type II secretion system F family protein [Acidobacteriota bacterium]